MILDFSEMSASASSSSSFLQMRDENGNHHHHHLSPPQEAAPPPPPAKRRRNQPGNPNPDAEVIALSPKTLMATNRFICEVCNKGFQREQNLQLHRRGHNLPWKLRQKGTKEVRRKVYLCPEPTCVHHDPSRALGDLTGIKKHYSRKHGEKKYKCEKCAKKYAVYSDWKAHSKTCGTREYRCDCGTLFSRRDSFITHRAFCDALAQESARNLTTPSFSGGIGSHILGLSQMPAMPEGINQTHDMMLRYGGGSRPGPQFDNLMSHAFGPRPQARGVPPQPPLFLHARMQQINEESQQSPHGMMQLPQMHMENGSASSSSAGGLFNLSFFPGNGAGAGNLDGMGQHSGSGGEEANIFTPGHLMSMAIPSLYSSSPHTVHSPSSAHMSATALLQKAAQYGSTSSASAGASSMLKPFGKPTQDGHSNFGIFDDNSNNSHLQDLVDSIAVRGGSSSVFGPGAYTTHHDHQQELDDPYRGFNGKSNSNSINHPQGFSNLDEEGRLTRDFLGVGEIVRSSFDSQGKTINQGFGGEGFN